MNRPGLFLTTFNLLEMTKKTIASLIQNTENYDLVIVDNNSADGTQEWVKQQGIPIIEFDKQTDLTVALNAGIRYFLSKDDSRFMYDVCWIHNDMTFYPDWLKKLQDYLEQHPKCGKVAPHNMRDPLAPERPGNELPCLIRGHILKKIGFYDERYKGIGGYEDWDLNRRIINEGFTVMITPESKIYHTGMATRSLRNTNDEQNYNNHQYFLKWGDRNCPV